jgi:hypothetical protein
VKDLLTAGQNTITVRLDTTLVNRMADLAGNPFWWGQGYFTFINFVAPLQSQPSGLLGPVRLIPAAVAKVG